MILLGSLVAYHLTRKRYLKNNGDTNEIQTLFILLLPSTIIGGRIYHLLTSLSYYKDHPSQIIKINQGGLGLPGAILAGILVTYLYFKVKPRSQSLEVFLNSVAPGILFAQAVGRFGNYFNQELYGKPTTLPWALKVEPLYRVQGFANYQTFHPTFLYESIWCVISALLILKLTNHPKLAGRWLFLLYLNLYSLGRFLMENLRIDPSLMLVGQRLNYWLFLLTFVATLALLIKHLISNTQE